MLNNYLLYLISLGLAVAIWTGCGSATLPKDALSTGARTVQDRQLQSRYFETADIETVLIASAQLMQDMGFNLEEAEEDLGLVTGDKLRDATHAGQQIGKFAAAALLGVYVPTDSDQRIRLSIVIAPAGEGRCKVRATFQRVIWNEYGQITKMEWLNNAELYQNFFFALSKSLFLEAHEI